MIGLYDSGVGGLSVMRQFLPHTVPLLYFGDTAHSPYGEKTKGELLGYFWEIAQFFKHKGVQVMVIACNTASALVLPEVECPPLPVFGIIEAGVESALSVCQGRLGILATRATVESVEYERAVRVKRPRWIVVAQKAPRLATLIEQGQLNTAVTRAALEEYLQPLIDAQVDTILLGCTHYPFVSGLIRELVGPSVRLVDPAPTLADYVLRWINEGNLPIGGETKREFWVSGDPEPFRRLAAQLLGMKIPSIKHLQMAEEQPPFWKGV